MFACNPVRLSLDDQSQLKATYLLTYLLTVKLGHLKTPWEASSNGDLHYL